MNDVAGGLLEEGFGAHVRDQPAATDDDQVIGRQRHLAHQVRRDKHRPPLGGEPLSRLRIQWIPSGSSPLTGSSSITVCGSPISADAIPSRWPMPSENLPARLRATSLKADEIDQLVDAGSGDAVRLREGEQMVVGGAARVDRPRFQERAHLVQRRGWSR